MRRHIDSTRKQLIFPIVNKKNFHSSGATFGIGHVLSPFGHRLSAVPFSVVRRGWHYY